MIKHGIPNIEDYQKLLKQDLFRQMEVFSNGFLERNHRSLKNYKKRWVSDPLHHWSRQYEYPFVAQKIAEYAKSKENIKILDAGSGVTFFPHYLKSQHPTAEIHCCDYDQSLGQTFSDINEARQSDIRFLTADLRHLPIEDESYDILYCISVLEHTNAFDKIIQEFKRVLKPGGLLIITFDISLDGHADIPQHKAKALVANLLNHFTPLNNLDHHIALEKTTSSEIITTKQLKKIDKKLLPWKYPWIVPLKQILKFQLPTTTTFDLTFFCDAFTKPQSSL